MKVLVIGGGGREHALCSAFAQSSAVREVIAAPGNAGIAAVARCVPIDVTDAAAMADLAESSGADLTFVGPEAPLAIGVVDEFERRGLRIIGPSRRAARLESSKAFAKAFMKRHSIPTADYAAASSAYEAASILSSGRFGGPEAPVVVKADGLAAGKGVVVAEDRAAALSAVASMSEIVGDDAASLIVVEECLSGPEISVLMFADGEDHVLMPAARDHKRIGEGDTGANTGGMGTITDDAILSAAESAEIVETIVRPTLRGCIEEGFRFRGILFLGLMMTADGPKVLEYNVRFGDPEAQSILIRLETDLVEICDSMLEGNLSSLGVQWRGGSSACVVLAAEGYPAKPRTGDVIQGLEKAATRDQVQLFHSATRSGSEGLVTSGGRVLGVTATGEHLETALARAYGAVAEIHWPGMQYRRDIGKTLAKPANGQA